jgi:hypothetical protein
LSDRSQVAHAGNLKCFRGQTSAPVVPLRTLLYSNLSDHSSSLETKDTPARASPTLHLPAHWAAVPLSGWRQKASRSTQQCQMPSPDRRAAQRRSGEAPHQGGSGTGSRAPVPGQVSSDARHRERGSHRVRSVALAERYVPVLPRHCRPGEARQLRARGGSGPPPAMRHNEQSLPSPSSYRSLSRSRYCCGLNPNPPSDHSQSSDVSQEARTAGGRRQAQGRRHGQTRATCSREH